MAPHAAQAQARSRPFASDVVSPPTDSKRLRGVAPPGVQPTQLDRQRGIIRKVPAPAEPPRLLEPIPIPREPGARSRFAPPPQSPQLPQPGVGTPVQRYKVLVPAERETVIAPRAVVPEGPPDARRIIIDDEEKITVDVQRGAGGEAIDSRVAVQRDDLSGLPFSAIGQILVQFPSGAAIGTGFLVHPRLVLTAAHVLLSPSLGRAVRAEFTPGCRAAGLPVKPGAVKSQPVSPDRLRVSEAWARGDTALASDYGALLLPDAVAFADCGVLSLAPVTEEFVHRHAVRGSPGFIVAGFPEDKPRGTQWYGSGALLLSPPAAIKHVIDTMPGQSGAPLIAIVVSKAGGGRTVRAVGIHSRPAEFSRNYNEARRIDERVLQDVRRWIDERPPSL
jgi:V8-like Glu-specific endopeptidase